MLLFFAMGFSQFKDNAMKKYDDAKKKGLADKDILKYLDKFNKLKKYYTTSSCSGRIMLVKNKEGINKLPDSFYFKSHEKISANEIMEKILKYSSDFELWLKMESFILHIGCRDLDSAKKLLGFCQLIGLKRCGIISLSKRIIVEISGTESLCTPIILDGKMIASGEYIKMLCKKSNIKLKEAKKRLFDFFKYSDKLK